MHTEYMCVCVCVCHQQDTHFQWRHVMKYIYAMYVCVCVCVCMMLSVSHVVSICNTIHTLYVCVCTHMPSSLYVSVGVCVWVHDAIIFACDKHMLYGAYIVCVCVHTYAIIIILTLIGKLQWCMYAVYVCMWVYVYGDTSCLKRECVALLKEPQWNKSHLLFLYSHYTTHILQKDIYFVIKYLRTQRACGTLKR